MLYIEVIVFAYFALGVLYTLIFSVAGNFKKSRPLRGDKQFNKIAILVPSYKEDIIIYGVAKSLRELNYPKEFFDVVIIADSLKKETVAKLRTLDIKVFEVSFEKSTKTKSLNQAMSRLDDSYEVALISDADNVPEKDFLLKVNEAYNDGYRAIQGQRIAKNLDTSFAVLDAASEIINNHIFRKGPNALGLSSALIGSGMAFEYKELKKFLSGIQAVGGFDKVLQLAVLEQGNKILYLNGALVYDEKIESSEAFKNQRRRWLSTQLIYFKKYFKKGFAELFKGNFDYFNIAIANGIFPPRVLMLGSLFILAAITFVLRNYLPLPFFYWTGLFGAYCFALAICLPRKFYNKKLFIAVLSLPKAFWGIVSALLKLKGADKQFIHTVKTKVEVDNILSKNEN